MQQTTWQDSLTLLAFSLILVCIPPSLANAGTAERPQAEGWHAYQRGAFAEAILKWEQALTEYRRLGKTDVQIDLLIRIAEAYQRLGRTERALDALTRANTVAGPKAAPAVQASMLASLGAIAISLGRDSEAEKYLRDGLSLAQDANATMLAATILYNLGNLASREARFEDAAADYAEALTRASPPLLKAHAHINRAMALFHLDRQEEGRTELVAADDLLKVIPPSHEHANALIALALGYTKVAAKAPNVHDALVMRAQELFNAAASEADILGDRRTLSYAWGYLGELYGTEGREEEALELTRRAIFSAQQAGAPESLYRWHWQAGRLFLHFAQTDNALAAYRRAIATLQSVRPELRSSYASSQISFRDSIGAVYFELADLLLRQASTISDSTQAEPYLKEARDVVELLKVDELRDYFGNECVEAAKSQIAALESVATTTAVVYPIILPDRLELLVTGRNHFHRVTVPIPYGQLTGEVRSLRLYLEKRTTREYLRHAQQLYDWIIRPLEPMLTSESVTTLVFVPDGPLRTIPMAVLHDGKRYLIEAYAIATTPGLTLTDARPLRREAVHALAVGLTQAVQGFSSLPNVAEEVWTVKRLFGGEVLLDEDFRIPRFEAEVRDKIFSVIHIATHGRFENDVRKSFLLAYDDRLTMDRLDKVVGLFRFRDEPLALLTLSGCETAAGDDRAALGLAGVAIRSGARSALATLWSINDEASSLLVQEFYKQLRDPTISKAIALQRAQTKLLEHPIYRHPAYWGPFLLLNNWL